MAESVHSWLLCHLRSSSCERVCATGDFCCPPSSDGAGELRWGGAKNGMAAAVMAARSWTKNVHSSGAHMAILKIDIKNAYNTINRGEVLSNVKEFCPQIYNLCAWRLGGSANIFWNGQRIESTCGVVQGDPLAPLMFVVGIHKIAMQLDLIPDLHQIWYLDDCLIFGDESSLKLALTKLQDSLKLLGLVLNYCK